MRVIENRIEHFLITNTVWLFLTTIVLVSFARILIVRAPQTWESMIYLEPDKWWLYVGYASSLIVIFLPILLLSGFRSWFKKGLGQKWLYPAFWGYCFIIHPILMTQLEIQQYFPNLPIVSDTIFVFGVLFLLIEIIIHFNDYLVRQLNIGQRLRQVKLERAIFFLVILGALYWAYATTPSTASMGETLLRFGKWFLLIFTCYAFYWINHYFLVEKLFRKKGVLYYLFGFMGVAMLFFPIFAFLLGYVEVHFQEWNLHQSAWIPKGERTTPFRVFPANLPWLWMLLSIPVVLVYQWWKQQNDIVSLEKEKSTAELNALKNQVNPHFLFNTLNALYALGIAEKGEKTADGIAKLGTLMRYNLNDAKSDFIPLKKELDYLEKYIELQQLRVTSNNDLRINIEKEESENYQIAPMLLIPFIENAFKFGVSATEPTVIDLKIQTTSNSLTMELYNTIIKNRQQIEGNGIGLSNTRKRLAHLYPNQYELIIEEAPNEFEVHLTIPLA